MAQHRKATGIAAPPGERRGAPAATESARHRAPARSDRALTVSLAVGAGAVLAAFMAPGHQAAAASTHLPGRGAAGGGTAPVGPSVAGVLALPQRHNVDSVQQLTKARRRTEDRAAAARAATNALAPDARIASPVGAVGSVAAPVSGTLTSDFGMRWGAMHTGLDIANAIGTPIFAVADGTVIDSGPAQGFGLWVRIAHDDGSMSVYGHINETLVAVGQRVRAGEQIATVGNRGQSTGPHLHFEIADASGAKVDPTTWLAMHGVALSDTVRP